LSRGLPFNLTTKQLAGVVYVGIALLAAGLVAFEANGLIQWYSTLNNINLRVSNVQFHLDGQPLGFPYLIVAATVFGPERYNDLTLSQLGFNVFVDSTNESFAVQDSSAVAQTVFVTQDRIPLGDSLNITTAVGLISDVITPLHDYLDRHNQTNLVTFVGVTLYFRSVYGSLSIPYCYQLPGNILTQCPPPRGPNGISVGHG